MICFCTGAKYTFPFFPTNLVFLLGMRISNDDSKV